MSNEDGQLNQSLQLLQEADMSIDDIFGCEQIRSPKWNNVVRRITDGPPKLFPKKNLFTDFPKDENLADISLPHYESVESLDIIINDNFFRPGGRNHESETSAGALSMDQLNTSDIFGENAIAVPTIIRPKKTIIFEFPSDENLENISEPKDLSFSSDSDSLSLIYSHEMLTDDIFNDSNRIDEADIDKLQTKDQPPPETNIRDQLDVIRQFNLDSSISTIQLSSEINDVIEEFCKIYNKMNNNK